jgi:hypothetical protein
MKRRHLVDDVGYTLASVEDILERGGPADWADLKNVVVAAPHGEVAALVLEVCGNAKIYGTTNLWAYFVRSLQHEADRERSIQAKPGPLWHVEQRAVAAERGADEAVDEHVVADAGRAALFGQ